jgi:hypothetical protein
MKEEEIEYNYCNDIDNNNNNFQLLNLDNKNEINFNNHFNNFDNQTNLKKENFNIINNNIINTHNYFQINFNQNFSYDNEPFYFNNFNNLKVVKNKIINSQITKQDLNAINSIIINDTSSQNIENNCHYLQMRIVSNANYTNEVLFPFLFPNMIRFINDQYGNYIYQGFIEVFNSKNLINFLVVIENNFNEISHSQNGTRVIQKLIEKSSNLKQGNNIIQKSLIDMLKGKVCQLSNDENANHIIQKFIVNIQFPYNNFIYEELYQNFMHIAITKYGCCVVQKCLINANKEQKEKIIYLVLQNTFNLIRDQFGNYVYQCVLMLKDEKINYKIIEIIYEKLIPLCKEKYSSNVIEKIFEINNIVIVNQLIDYITKTDNKILELITNKYGNYIIQKILSICTDKNLFFRILNTISQNIILINNVSFGKKLISKLSEKYPILNEMIISNQM